MNQPHPTPNLARIRQGRITGMGRAFINSTQNSLAGIVWDLGKSMGPTPGVKTPITPDKVGAVDAG